MASSGVLVAEVESRGCGCPDLPDTVCSVLRPVFAARRTPRGCLAESEGTRLELATDEERGIHATIEAKPPTASGVAILRQIVDNMRGASILVTRLAHTIGLCCDELTITARYGGLIKYLEETLRLVIRALSGYRFRLWRFQLNRSYTEPTTLCWNINRESRGAIECKLITSGHGDDAGILQIESEYFIISVSFMRDKKRSPYSIGYNVVLANPRGGSAPAVFRDLFSFEKWLRGLTRSLEELHNGLAMTPPYGDPYGTRDAAKTFALSNISSGVIMGLRYLVTGSAPAMMEIVGSVATSYLFAGLLVLTNIVAEILSRRRFVNAR